MGLIKFTKGASSFSFSRPRVYPLDDPVQVNVPTSMSDGGQLYAYDKGIEEQFFNLTFEDLTGTDFTNFETWLKTTACGPKNTFTYTDEAGTDHTVRLLDTKNPLKKTGNGKYGGTIQLRKEI
ncbi:MAG: hypothetical protein JW884_14275 [Deltaproteobacteria bacterium]|nr:hypothetical protein [Deltaproteobacteria bacterium]